MAIFFSAATAAGAFGGLLARGINEMSGTAGLGGWAWIFILEGLVTFVVAVTGEPILPDHSLQIMADSVLAYFVMQDYPSTAKFLTEPERTEVTRRLVHDRSSLADEFDMKYFWHAVKDWKIWVHM